MFIWHIYPISFLGCCLNFWAESLPVFIFMDLFSFYLFFSLLGNVQKVCCSVRIFHLSSFLSLNAYSECCDLSANLKLDSNV